MSQINLCGVILLAIAVPFGAQVNDGDNHHTPFAGCKNYAYFLPIAGGAFERIFGIGAAGGFAFAVVDAAFFENFPHFGLVDMAAAHTATGMFGINEMTGVAVDSTITGVGSNIVFLLRTVIIPVWGFVSFTGVGVFLLRFRIIISGIAGR